MFPCLSRRTASVGMALVLMSLPGPGLAQVTELPSATCPQDGNPSAAAGWDAYQEDDIPRAREGFREALERCPSHLGAVIGMGYVELRDDRVAAASTRFETALERAPDSIDALLGAGLAAWREARLDDVARHFLRVNELDPGNATARE